MTCIEVKVLLFLYTTSVLTVTKWNNSPCHHLYLLLSPLFVELCNLSAILENDVLESIRAFAFTNLSQLTYMWVYSCLKSQRSWRILSSVLCVFSLLWNKRSCKLWESQTQTEEEEEEAGRDKIHQEWLKKWRLDFFFFFISYLCVFPQRHLWKCGSGENWSFCFLQSAWTHWDVSTTDIPVVSVVKPCNYKSNLTDCISAFMTSCCFCQNHRQVKTPELHPPRCVREHHETAASVSTR